MKIYFNRRPILGPWGGGSKVLNEIVEECKSRSHELFFEEDIKLSLDFDVIFCMDPRPNHASNFYDLMSKKNSGNIFVQRVGDLGTHGKPDLLEVLKRTSSVVDKVIFPSEWAKNYLTNISGIKDSVVIPNAPLKKFIDSKKSTKYSGGTMKLVTHHWSDNNMKGFDVYEKLDKFCESKGDTTFTYIGRKPSGVFLKNSIGPQDVESLSRLLAQNHVYVTASKKEAGANHVLEAMALGLPILYHKDGGSINEYCQSRGIEYEDFDHLIEILSDKSRIRDLQNVSYERTSLDMAREYVDFFERWAHENQHKH